MHFSNKKCDVSTPTEECQRLLLCLKKKDEQIGTIEFLYTVFRNLNPNSGTSIKSISSDILGPILMAIAGIMIKIIEVMTDQKETPRKDH